MHIHDSVHTDVLVIGSGLSGIRVTKELASRGFKVLMATKTHLAAGSSFFPLKASLGTQVTKDEADREVFREDVDAMSRGMNDPELTETYIDEIPEAVAEYKDIGVKAKKLQDERKACFAEHPRDIYLLSDWNGTRENVREIFGSMDNIALMTKTVVVKLLVDDGRITGAVAIDQGNRFIHISCDAVMLCTGGFGTIYKHNLNPNDVDGSGHMLALDAGAKLVNMEFIQFIPGITHPKYKTLFGEHTLKYCTDVVDRDGNSIMGDMLPDGMDHKELMDIRSTHGPFTHTLESRHFDIAMMSRIIEEKKEDGFRLMFDDALYETGDEFYSVYLDWLKGHGIDMVKDAVHIAPFAHASNGGVLIDKDGRTGVNGLYALGELSCNVEGANRLGGNSTGACMVFGKRAAKDCSRYLQNAAGGSTIEDAETALRDFNGMNTPKHLSEQPLPPETIVKEVQELMWYYANVVRIRETLEQALAEIDALSGRMESTDLTASDRPKLAVKAMNFIRLAKVLLEAMLERKESRGAHYRADHPEESAQYNTRLMVELTADGVDYRFMD